MDMTGKLVRQERIPTSGSLLRTEISFERGLPSGQYFLRASAAERTVLQRFVVAH